MSDKVIKRIDCGHDAKNDPNTGVIAVICPDCGVKTTWISTWQEIPIEEAKKLYPPSEAGKAESREGL